MASSWSTTYDRLIVIDEEGKMIFKGSRAAKSDADAAKSVIQNALNNFTTSIDIVDARIGFSLGQNYPNPASEETRIDFSLGKASEVKISILDLSGKIVSVPVHDFYLTGNYSVSVQGLNRGIYFYKMESGDFVQVKKMIIQ